jgi:hypothetical protein
MVPPLAKKPPPETVDVAEESAQVRAEPSTAVTLRVWLPVLPGEPNVRLVELGSRSRNVAAPKIASPLPGPAERVDPILWFAGRKELMAFGPLIRLG